MTDEIDGLVLQAALHLKKEEHGQLEASLRTWQHLFAASKGDLRQTNIIQHKINTGVHPAVKQQVCRLANGITRRVAALVKKKDGGTRFCINYCRLNQATKVDACPMPNIKDSLKTLGGARFFCSLDLASGYWQVEMDAMDREKTTFVTEGGLYLFKVMQGVRTG